MGGRATCHGPVRTREATEIIAREIVEHLTAALEEFAAVAAALESQPVPEADDE